MKKSSAIEILLQKKGHPDMRDLYNDCMEVQVNVAKDDGELVGNEFKGRKGVSYSDGATTWASFRIPRNSMSEPEDNDSEITFDIAHAEAVGLTGWDWKNRRSLWVAFDFDTISGHSEKHRKVLTSEQMAEVMQKAISLPYVTVRKSTSGKGLHLYVDIRPVETKNHCEHAALARAILGKMGVDCGFDFAAKVDTCGGNMWIWARKSEGTDGYSLVKRGEVLDRVPVNWRDHIEVVKGNRHRTAPERIVKSVDKDAFEQIVGQNNRIPLDDVHRALLAELERLGALFWFDPDCHMLVTHTIWLAKAHESLGLKGVFKTSAPGHELFEQNCFCFPMRNGAWSVRRYSQGAGEHDSWTQDGVGWTRCYLNRSPDIETAARAEGGSENQKGWFVFPDAHALHKALDSMSVSLGLDLQKYGSREAKYKPHDGRILVAIERKEHDTRIDGWTAEKKEWHRILNVAQTVTAIETPPCDDMVRHLVANGEDAGWVISSEKRWNDEPLTHVNLSLKAQGMGTGEVSSVTGNAILRPWELVSIPFASEYPGERKWNRNSAQLRYAPSQHDQLSYPTWIKLLEHSGRGIDSEIKANNWCKANGIRSGADYLKAWMAHVLQNPFEHLPYLFFCSVEQNTGKSTFHEAMDLILTKGYTSAVSALTDQRGFNSELHGAVVCVVEELNVASSKSASDRIKAWVTGRSLPIHPKGGSVYQVPNTTHWIQTANDPSYCPIFPGDTRITMIPMYHLENPIPSRVFNDLLMKEAPDFVAELMRIELPPPPERLNLPVIATEAKRLQQSIKADEVEVFLENSVEPCPGAYVLFGEMYAAFAADHPGISEINFGRRVNTAGTRFNFLKGRYLRLSNQVVIANCKMVGKPPTKTCNLFTISPTGLIQES